MLNIFHTWHRPVRPAAAVGVFLVGLLPFALPVQAQPTSYSFTTIDEPNNTPLAAFTSASGINDAGQIVGSYLDSSLVPHGFLLSGGTYTTIDPPGTLATSVGGSGLAGINNAGQMVGLYADTTGNVHGFLDNAGTFTPIDDPSAPAGAQTRLTGISNAGAMVGNYSVGAPGSGVTTGFSLVGSTFTTIQDPNEIAGDGGTFVSGINSSGDIVGLYNFANQADSHGFLLSGGVYSTLDFPAANTRVTDLAINDAGLIFGSATDGTLDFLFFDNGGSFNVIPDPYTLGGNADIDARGINNLNDIVGEIADINGNHGYVGTPVPAPEPASLLTLGSGLLGLALRRRRRPHP
jgi:hypothetical protein